MPGMQVPIRAQRGSARSALFSRVCIKIEGIFQKLKWKLKPRAKFPKTQGEKLELSEALASSFPQIVCSKKTCPIGSCFFTMVYGKVTTDTSDFLSSAPCSEPSSRLFDLFCNHKPSLVSPSFFVMIQLSSLWVQQVATCVEKWRSYWDFGTIWHWKSGPSANTVSSLCCKISANDACRSRC